MTQNPLYRRRQTTAVPAFGVLTKAHFGGGGVGHLYRLILGLGLAGMAASGGMIYLKIRARTRKP